MTAFPIAFFMVNFGLARRAEATKKSGYLKKVKYKHIVNILVRELLNHHHELFIPESFLLEACFCHSAQPDRLGLQHCGVGG
jgi:predicted subunit of tRNA(5-methylaminomethyl-2-thiouridylate) methyltransferase